ncbi:hypothetical protein [uncultured Winogradskyella sp.]|uniref:hypothetical protein n=1 Tax=uncultured Winogradskyella sp. TaxID=395353 RepID=UPI00260D862E|nr:hypothetical protein [uncultured Winogradskyella sp.]
MKKIILAFALLAFSFNSFAQLDSNEWYLSFGVNAINNLGTQSPINSPDDWAFNKVPVSAAVEFSWSRQFSIEQSITLNGFTTSSIVDGNTINKELDYVSFDTHVKYYFGQYLFPNADWIDFFANAGVGFYHIDETNISGNLGGGVLFWLNGDRTFGLRAQAISKFALDASDSGYDNNHFQYHLQATIRL